MDSMHLLFVLNFNDDYEQDLVVITNIFQSTDWRTFPWWIDFDDSFTRVHFKSSEILLS